MYLCNFSVILDYGSYHQQLVFCNESRRGYSHKCTKVLNFKYNNITLGDRAVYIY